MTAMIIGYLVTKMGHNINIRQAVHTLTLHTQRTSSDHDPSNNLMSGNKNSGIGAHV